MQLFCFLLKLFFENVKKSLRSGFLERVGRVTVNTTLFFFSPKHNRRLIGLYSFIRTVLIKYFLFQRVNTLLKIKNAQEDLVIGC